MNKLLLIIFGTIFFFSQNIIAQDVPGCTDPQANNYNPQAPVAIQVVFLRLYSNSNLFSLTN